MAAHRISPFISASLVVEAGWIACKSGPESTEDQERGQRIYEGLCNKCHTLIDPEALSYQAWVIASVKYETQPKLTRDEISSLQDYLTRANDTDKKD